MNLSCANYSRPYEPMGCFYTCFKQKYLKDKIKVIVTGDCRAKRLNSLILQQFKFVETFNIFQHGIDLLSPLELKFHNLLDFNASHNELVNISASTFEYAPKITVIDFSFNKLTLLESGTFSKLLELKILDLSNNLIETIDENMFEFNVKLELLRIQFNPIKRFDGNIFRPMLNATTVEVTCRHLEEFDTSCLKRSLKMELEKNEIVFDTLKNSSKLRCPVGSFGNATYFNISGNFQENTMRIVELLGLPVKILDLSKNAIGTSKDKVLRIARILVKFKNLTYLSVAGMNLSDISFRGMWPKQEYNLKTFDISNNQLNSVNFIGRFENLEKFNANNNNLTVIPGSLFKSMPNVSELNLAFNKISTLDNETFAKLVNLEKLDLRNNEISSFDRDFIANSPKLQELRLENNRIARFDCNILPLFRNSYHELQKPTNFENNWNALEELDLSCMENLHIELDDENGFILRGSHSFLYPLEMTTLRHLRSFNISGLNLKNTAQILSSLGSSLKKLDIAANFVGELNPRTFETFENLQVLNLSQANLSNFGFETFYHQRKLKKLDLSKNHLKKVNFTLFFRNFKELNELNLEGNDLQEIDTVTPLIFPNLTSLAISKNSFSCDYLATFLLHWHNLQLVFNPSNQTQHIDGTDCYHMKTAIIHKGENTRNPEIPFEGDKSEEIEQATTELTFNTTQVNKNVQQPSTETMSLNENSPRTPEIHTNRILQAGIATNYILLELRVVEGILAIFVVICGILCFILGRRKAKLQFNNRQVASSSRYGDIELIENELS